MSEIQMQVPRIQGLPKHTLGSTQMCCNSGFMCPFSLFFLKKKAPSGLCCKKYEENKLSVECLSLFSLGSDSKQRGDPCNLPSHVSFCHPLQLSLPEHIHDLKSLESSPRRLQREKAHPRLCQALTKCWIQRWSCSMRLLRYFTCRNSQCSEDVLLL